ILGLPAGRLEEGGPADIAVFDPNAEWVVDPALFASKGRNTPFAGMTLRGIVRATLCDGAPVYEA
ncbi:MAG: amidohydrolase family protein, partial [Candidatus Hydrogenedentes bacterium]|nr:amidohydrolase family protein [Candidatus Hydrogenedentota bacterium]